MQLSGKHCSVIFTYCSQKTNEAETSVGKLYYIHLHSQWEGIYAMAKKLHLQKVAKPIKVTEDKIDIVFLNFKL